MLVRPYEMPWRPAYEMWAGAAWVVGLCFFVYLGGKGILTSTIALGLAFFAFLMAAHRLRQGLGVLTVRASLSGKAMQIITTRRHETLTRDPGQVFLGFGFEWLPVHSQPKPRKTWLGSRVRVSCLRVVMICMALPDSDARTVRTPSPCLRR